MSNQRLFVGGVPATGKSWLGQWLAANHGYIHIDAERNGGADFDGAGIHADWDDLISRGRADRFATAAERLAKPVLVNWGFPPRYLYVVAALQAAGFAAWWLHAPRETARRAFVHRGGIEPAAFDSQMANIEREWLLIERVFRPRIVEGLRSDGSQRAPQEIWRDICAAG
jgi:predicted kinase